MARATLKFALPEEQEDLDLALKARALQGLVDDILNKLREEYKYKNTTNSDYADKLRTEIYSTISELGLSHLFL